MTSLVPRENLFQNLFEFRRDFDQLFNHILAGNPLMPEFVPGKKVGFLPAVESYVDKDGKTYICRVSIPGIEAKDVEIQLVEHLLTIKGERKAIRTTNGFELMDEEIVYGKFERTIELPEGVVAEKLTAEYKNGVLEITAPMALAALPRKIEIKNVPLVKQVTA
ncbi:MAG TPA: Hsp20/alpha crystallin family protein [Candidatus Acidoferrum sp.]|nr:Hsp20/alpha crystallin family protein [Candidatus Acidoferrum sp.]